MPLANIVSEWSSGDLVFKDKAAKTSLFSIMTSTDLVRFYGSTTSTIYADWVNGSNMFRMTGAHFALQTATDTYTIRLNSRNYTATSGDIIGYQSKPAANATGTATVYGSQVSPRFNHGVAGASLVGVQSNPILKGTAAAGGNLSGDVRAVEGRVESEDGGTRTVAGTVSCFAAYNNLFNEITVTGGIYAIEVKAKQQEAEWTGFAKLPDDSGNMTKYSAGHYTPGNCDGGIKITLGGHDLWVPAYDALS